MVVIAITVTMAVVMAARRPAAAASVVVALGTDLCQFSLWESD